eukprot:15452938-Alexandrium_andersonii.AAC.1
MPSPSAGRPLFAPRFECALGSGGPSHPCPPFALCGRLVLLGRPQRGCPHPRGLGCLRARVVCL